MQAGAGAGQGQPGPQQQGRNPSGIPCWLLRAVRRSCCCGVAARCWSVLLQYVENRNHITWVPAGRKIRMCHFPGGPASSSVLLQYSRRNFTSPGSGCGGGPKDSTVPLPLGPRHVGCRRQHRHKIHGACSAGPGLLVRRSGDACTALMPTPH